MRQVTINGNRLAVDASWKLCTSMAEAKMQLSEAQKKDDKAFFRIVRIRDVVALVDAGEKTDLAFAGERIAKHYPKDSLIVALRFDNDLCWVYTHIRGIPQGDDVTSETAAKGLVSIFTSKNPDALVFSDCDFAGESKEISELNVKRLNDSEVKKRLVGSFVAGVAVVSSIAGYLSFEQYKSQQARAAIENAQMLQVAAVRAEKESYHTGVSYTQMSDKLSELYEKMPFKLSGWVFQGLNCQGQNELNCTLSYKGSNRLQSYVFDEIGLSSLCQMSAYQPQMEAISCRFTVTPTKMIETVKPQKNQAMAEYAKEVSAMGGDDIAAFVRKRPITHAAHLEPYQLYDVSIKSAVGRGFLRPPINFKITQFKHDLERNEFVIGGIYATQK